MNEVVRLLEHPDFPKDRMILDVRGNGGGLILAGERLLQLFTTTPIEPTRAQLAVTPLTVELCRADGQLAPWMPSLERAVETAAAFSAAFPITPPERCNDIGRRYPGAVVLITDARCYSTTDMFAAGFKEHGIGKILGVDDNTGAGGANVWTIELLRQILRGAGALRPLPKGGSMRVAIRRTLRVGPQAGTEIEDLGVEPDVTHRTTFPDLLGNDVDLLEEAAGSQPRGLLSRAQGPGSRLRRTLPYRGVVDGRLLSADLSCPDAAVRKLRLLSHGGSGILGRVPTVSALSARDQPGAPAWTGTAATVNRALRLIAEEGPEPRTSHLGAILGVVQAGGGLGGAIGPFLGGWLFDVTGSYHLAFTAACLAVAGSAVAAWIATRQPPVAATTRPVVP